MGYKKTNLLEINKFHILKNNVNYRDVVAEIKPGHFYGDGSTDNMISILHCADGRADIAGCEIFRGCMSGVGFSLKCSMYTYVILFLIYTETDIETCDKSMVTIGAEHFQFYFSFLKCTMFSKVIKILNVSCRYRANNSVYI